MVPPVKTRHSTNAEELLPRNIENSDIANTSGLVLSPAAVNMSLPVCGITMTHKRNIKRHLEKHQMKKVSCGFM